MSTSPLTELEAVNKMLRCIGEAPVNSLTTSGLSDVGIAVQILSEVGREVQTEGWQFNSELEYPLVPTVPDGFLTPPTNALKVWPSQDYFDIDPVVRGVKLYDRKNRTYAFTKTYKFNIVVALAFEELPQAARQYVMVKAARRFQANLLGSDTQHAFTQEQEFEMRSAMMEAEGETADYNILTSDHSLTILDR